MLVRGLTSSSKAPDYWLSRYKLRSHSTDGAFGYSPSLLLTVRCPSISQPISPLRFLFRSCCHSSHSPSMLCRVPGQVRQFCISTIFSVWLCNFSTSLKSSLLFSTFFCLLSFLEIFIYIYSSIL